MATIAAADLLPILDSMGLADVARLALVSTTEGGDIADSGDNAVADVLTFTDIAQTAGLANGARLYQLATVAPIPTREQLFSSFLSAIKTHLVVPLNTYLTTNTAKVSKNFATLFRALYGAAQLLPAHVFEDTHITLATWTYTGSGTGTPNYTGGPLDMALVAPNQLELAITTDIGASGNVSLTCVKADGSTEVKVVAVSTADDAGEFLDVGISTDVYKDVSLITSTGGLSGAFTVRNKWPRTPAI